MPAETSPVEPVPAIQESPLVDPVPQSMLRLFYSIAHADSHTTDVTSTGSELAPAASATDPIPAPSAIVPTLTALRVTYTIDGLVWNDLGVITESGTHNFDLVLTKESDLLGLVVRVEPTDFVPGDRAFVESMALKLTYDSALVEDALVGMTPIVASMPNILSTTFESFRGVGDSAVFIATTESGRALFLVDLATEGSTAKRIAAGDYLLDGSPLGVKGGRIFWLSKDDHVLSYRMEDDAYFKTPLIVNGENASFEFDDFGWFGMLRNNEFMFTSPETGEVGGDNDGSVAERFGKVFLGDLQREDVLQLGLVLPATPIEETVDSGENYAQ